MTKTFWILCFLYCSIPSLLAQVDSVATISPQEYKRRQTAAEQKWSGTFKGMYEDWLLRWVKPYVVLYKYTDGSTEEFGYLNFGNGQGWLEVSEMEYRILRQYIK